MKVEIAVEPRVLEQSQRARDIAGEAELDAEVPCASASVEQDAKSVVVDERHFAEVDHELVRLASKRAVSRSAEGGRVGTVKCAADHENGAPAVGPVRDLERTIRPRGLARCPARFEIPVQRNLRATAMFTSQSVETVVGMRPTGRRLTTRHTEAVFPGCGGSNLPISAHTWPKPVTPPSSDPGCWFSTLRGAECTSRGAGSHLVSALSVVIEATRATGAAMAVAAAGLRAGWDRLGVERSSGAIGTGAAVSLTSARGPRRRVCRRASPGMG